MQIWWTDLSKQHVKLFLKITILYHYNQSIGQDSPCHWWWHQSLSMSLVPSSSPCCWSGPGQRRICGWDPAPTWSSSHQAAAHDVFWEFQQHQLGARLLCSSPTLSHYHKQMACSSWFYHNSSQKRPHPSPSDWDGKREIDLRTVDKRLNLQIIENAVLASRIQYISMKCLDNTFIKAI